MKGKSKQLVNAIELFEMGYFDCAYYSLRSAVEVSTTMVYLSDLPEAEREKQLEAWKATSTSMETFQSQVGKASENFSQQLSSEEQTVKRSLKKLILASLIPTVYSVPIRPLARENKASGTESKAIFTEAKATSIINMAHIIV